MKYALTAILGTVVLTGCATVPPTTSADKMCNFHPTPAVIDDEGYTSKTDQRTDVEHLVIPMSVLILSGGGEKGAFGAGFLKGWAEQNGGKLPDFDSVTGISTGALQATWAYLNEPEQIFSRYQPESESKLLKAYTHPKKSGDLSISSAITLLRKNALADLNPLRNQLLEIVDGDLLTRVANKGGLLQVGAVDVDNGKLQMFNLSEMAKKAAKYYKKNDNEYNLANQNYFDLYRGCYIDAILASSSAPIGAKPVFIDNRMYVDGGVRQGSFVDFMTTIRRYWMKIYAQHPNLLIKAPSGDRLLAPKIFMITNGTNWVDVRCGGVDANQCNSENPYDPEKNEGKFPHKKWSVMYSGFRSSEIMTNQIYRFSQANTENQYAILFPEDKYVQRLYHTRMHRRSLFGYGQKPFSFKDSKTGIEKTCPKWREYDKEKTNPVQFHVNYMKCLAAYGYEQGKMLNWGSGDSGPDLIQKANDKDDQ